MNVRSLVILSIFTITLAFTFLYPEKANAGKIMIVQSKFKDYQRDREIPFLYYAPDPVTKPLPVVIFSPGLGGSIGSSQYLGEELAANGYIAYFLEHPGTRLADVDQIRKKEERKIKLKFSVGNPDQLIHRHLDILHVLNEIERLNSDSGPSYGTMNLDRIGIAAQGYGTRNALLLAGETQNLVKEDLKDPRIKAAFLISPLVASSYIGKSNMSVTHLFNRVDIPTFHVTGSEDNHLYHDWFRPDIRLMPFKNIQNREKHLLVLEGASHSAFSAGNGIYNYNQNDTRYHNLLSEAAVVFFDIYLKDGKRPVSDLDIGFRELVKRDDINHHFE